MATSAKERFPLLTTRCHPRPATLLDPLDVAVALGRVGVRRAARYGGRSGRDDYRSVGRVRGDRAVDGLSVVSAVREHRGERTVDLIEQRADQRGVAVPLLG
jgi:hypothetical protein